MQFYAFLFLGSASFLSAPSVLSLLGDAIDAAAAEILKEHGILVRIVLPHGTATQLSADHAAIPEDHFCQFRFVESPRTDVRPIR